MLCAEPDPTNHGAPCDQEAAYRVRHLRHGLLGEHESNVCADHLAWWREAFPDSILGARSLSGDTA